MMGYLDTQGEAPPSATLELKAAFHRTSIRIHNDVKRSRKATAAANNISKTIQAARPVQGSLASFKWTKTQSSFISERLLRYGAHTLSHLGMETFLPDLVGDADELDNWTHRYILVELFRFGVRGRFLDHWGCDSTWVDDDANLDILFDIYNHYVHFRLAGLHRRQLKVPGSVVRSNAQHARRRTMKAVSI
jgi:hypothetical protein